MSGILYLVATPIGNLADITLRAIDTLKSSDVICAEDTRRARILLDKYSIAIKPHSYHEHNALRMAVRIVGWVDEGKTVSLISDAGTPGISDPGFRAVRAVLDAGLRIECIPGATSVTTSLVLSGLGVDRFAFEGFLPVKKGRKSRLAEIAAEKRTTIIFEGPHKLAKTLKDLNSVIEADRKISLAREITKLHEEVVRTTLGDLLDRYEKTPPRGEIVLVIEGRDAYLKRLKRERVENQSNSNY